MDQQIWQWTLTKEAVAPCFVRDVLAMRQNANSDADFFWLGHTPCRTVLLVAMVVAIQVYDKRSIYTIDDGTAVIDCVLRHPRSKVGPDVKHPIPPLDEPPPPVTEPGYPVRVVGRVARHYQSKQIYADTIDPCASSLDEISHLERVIELHKAKYSQAVPFLPPVVPPPSTSTPHADASVFSDTSLPSRTGPITYTLPPPPLPLHNRNHPPPLPTHGLTTYHGQTHVPSSPTASSVASSTPSSPCKPSSPVKLVEKPKLRHPSRLHTRDLTANIFRIYVKHYMDNAPPPFVVSCSSPSRSTCGGPTTPTKCVRGEENDDPTPRPHPRARAGDIDNEDDPKLGFTLSHLRRVPELALLAARVVRAESRKREKAEREKERGHSRITSASFNGRGEGHKRTPRAATGATADPPRKKIKRLFSWAVVKLYEEGSIILWDGDVRPLPVPPPPLLEGHVSGLWKGGDDTLSTAADISPSFDSCASASVLYTSSASAPLFSHYHAPRRPSGSRREPEGDAVDVDADPAYLSDPPADEEAYVPLTPRFLTGYVREALAAVRRGPSSVNVNGRPRGKGREPTPGDVLTYMQRADGRWARLGVWVVEEALEMLRTG